MPATVNLALHNSSACRYSRDVERPTDVGRFIVDDHGSNLPEQVSVHDYSTAASAMAMKSSGRRLAPPTSAPSISGCSKNGLAFPGLTLPP